MKCPACGNVVMFMREHSAMRVSYGRKVGRVSRRISHAIFGCCSGYHDKLVICTKYPFEHVFPLIKGKSMAIARFDFGNKS